MKTWNLTDYKVKKGKLILSVLDGRLKEGFTVEILDVVKSKITMLNSVYSLGEFRAILGKRLEKSNGNRKGQYSIRINNQWRICFFWTDQGLANVEIIDYQ